MTLGEKLKAAREARALSVEEVAGRLSVTTRAIYQYENDETIPRMPKLERLSAIYECDLAWLLNKNDTPAPAARVAPENSAPSQRAVPVISYVQAGAWSLSFEHAMVTEYIFTDVPVSDDAFALIVKGFSMLPDFAPEDKVIVDPRVRPAPGDFVVAQIDGEAETTLKRYRDRGRDARGPIIDLTPSNPDYPTLRIDGDNPGRIVGTVVERRSYLGAPRGA